MEGLGSVRCSAVSLGPTGQVVPTGRVVTNRFWILRLSLEKPRRTCPTMCFHYNYYYFPFKVFDFASGLVIQLLWICLVAGGWI